MNLKQFSNMASMNRVEVFYQGVDTVVKDLASGEVYISRPEKGEKYDREKGLMMSLLKYLGITATQFNTIYENGIECRGRIKKEEKPIKNNKRQGK